jgi:hypothetical protein
MKACGNQTPISVKSMFVISLILFWFSLFVFDLLAFPRCTLTSKYPSSECSISHDSLKLGNIYCKTSRDED